MPLPFTRPRTYVDGMPLEPDDINEIFDAIINGKQNNRWFWQSPGGCTLQTSIQYDPDFDFGGSVFHATADAAVLSGVPVHGISAGDTITNIGIFLTGVAAAQTVSVYLMRSTGLGGGRAPVAQLDIVNPPASVAKYTFALPTPYPVVDGDALYWSIHIPKSGTIGGALGHAKERP